MSSRNGPSGHGSSTDATLVAGNTTTGATNTSGRSESHGPAPVAPTIDQVVAGIFTRLDADTDGSITSAELLAVIDPDGSSTERSAAVAKLITQLDTSADGKLSTAEVKTAVTALDTDGSGTLDRADHPAVVSGTATPDLLGLLLGHPRGGHEGHGGHGDHDDDGTPPTPPTIAKVVSAVFTALDTDTSTTISLKELLAAIDPSGTHAERTADATTLFGKVDANTDGSVSTAELTTFVTTLDTDGSGTLSHADLAPGQNPHLTPELMGALLHLADAHHGPGF